MPYITKENRKKYNNITDIVANYNIEAKGDLEYLIFSLMVQFMRTRERKYSTLHDVVYAAQHCADEFRRRFLDEREDTARKENGDVE